MVTLSVNNTGSLKTEYKIWRCEMAKLIAKILLFSDPHRSVNSKDYEEKWFPPICSFLSKIEKKYFFPSNLTKKFLNFWDRTTQQSFRHMLEIAKAFQPFEYVFGTGDYTPGSNESGMLTDAAVNQYKEFEKDLNFHIVCKKLLAWGDHDVGYRFNVSKKTGIKIGTEKGGISTESVKVVTRLIGPPYGILKIHSSLFIYIATNLIRNVDKDSPKELRDLKEKQESFLAEALHDSQVENNFLFLHDPTSLLLNTAVRKIIDFHRRKISVIFHGHLHAEYSARLTRLVHSSYRNLCKNYRVELIPASWGMMGIGKGFCVLKLFDGGSYQIERHKT